MDNRKRCQSSAQMHSQNLLFFIANLPTYLPNYFNKKTNSDIKYFKSIRSKLNTLAILVFKLRL